MTPDNPGPTGQQPPGSPVAEASLGADGASPRIHRLEFRAMGCQMTAWVASDDAQHARTRLNGVWAYFHVVERTLSRFLPHSELVLLNKRSGRPVRVSTVLWQVLIAALDAADDTGGLFDPTILDALEASGYRRTFEAIANGQAESTPAPVGGSDWRDIGLDPDTRTVTLPFETRIDLGGVAKGWTAQQAAGVLAPLGPCLVDAGGDIAARGSPAGYGGWPIGIADPADPETDLAALCVKDSGVATSGVDYRRWQTDGKSRHHIIDPNTRLPSETDLLTVTVVASDAIQADVHATVALQLGMENGYRYLAQRADVDGLLVGRDRRMATTPGFDRRLLENASPAQMRDP